MRKSVLLMALLCASSVLFAQEEEALKGAHPYKVGDDEKVSTEFAHWSIIPHVGFNAFDGDFNAEKKHPIGYPSAGLALEYAFTPVWGVGLEYMFSWYNVTGDTSNPANAETLLRGMMHRAEGYVSMDFINLFFPRARKKIVSIQAVAGGGYAWYKSDTYYPDPSRGHTATYINSKGEVGPESMENYKGAPFIGGGLNVEFNLNRTIALGVRATYNYFINDYPDGRGYSGMQSLASKNNDGLVDVTLNMRFKLEAVSKTHVRNIANEDKLLARMAELEKEPTTNAGMGMCHDTVIIYHDTIIKQYREVQKDEQNVYYVYFDNGKAIIKEDGLITIQQVADRLEEDSTLYAVVTGFCDNTGSDKLNYVLGDKRAANVMDELSQEHGISDERMYAMGMGKLVGRRSQAAYGPNRRASIRLVDKATFERMKQNLDDKKAQRGEEFKTVPLSESSKQEKVNTFAIRDHEETVVEKSTTLSKLARQYYSNTHCWVYIYIANKDRISNPNALEAGSTLIIPELTTEEMQITKDQCLRLYYNARNSK